METTKNVMPEYNNAFFNKLKIYLDTPVYFFGSVQRDDYFPKGSDIDVAIFTDNMKSTISKLQSFLKVNRQDFKEFVWRLNCDNSLAKGYKIMYREPARNFNVEISIYDAGAGSVLVDMETCFCFSLLRSSAKRFSRMVGLFCIAPP